MARAGFLVWHRRVALLFAPFLLTQALTGAALLYRAPLARALDERGMTRQTVGPIAPVSRLQVVAQAAMPGYRVSRLYLPATDRDTAFAEMTGPGGSSRRASIDPASAKVLAQGTIWHFPLEAVLQLHYRLTAGKVGMAIVLANALAIVTLAASGIAFWWPGRQRMRKSLAIRAAAPGRIRLRQWHRKLGICGAILLLFSATTGALLIVPDLVAPGGSAADTLLPSRTMVQVDRAVALAMARFPASPVRDIRFPAADRIDVNLFAPQRNPRAVHIVSVRLSDGSVTKALAAGDNPVLWMKVLSLHTGDSLGPVGHIILLINAALIAALALSGPWMWWQARRVGAKVNR
ncbi:MAG: PepSY-associated TM helix domain-containing protein [Sphingomicrobium sp.]